MNSDRSTAWMKRAHESCGTPTPEANHVAVGVQKLASRHGHLVEMVIHGKVESGTVRIGDKLTLAPHNHACQVLNVLDSKN